MKLKEFLIGAVMVLSLGALILCAFGCMVIKVPARPAPPIKCTDQWTNPVDCAASRPDTGR